MIFEYNAENGDPCIIAAGRPVFYLDLFLLISSCELSDQNND